MDVTVTTAAAIPNIFNWVRWVPTTAWSWTAALAPTPVESVPIAVAPAAEALVPRPSALPWAPLAWAPAPTTTLVPVRSRTPTGAWAPLPMFMTPLA